MTRPLYAVAIGRVLAKSAVGCTADAVPSHHVMCGVLLRLLDRITGAVKVTLTVLYQGQITPCLVCPDRVCREPFDK